MKDSITALGCHATNDPARVEPALDKLARVSLGILDLVHAQWASPLAVAAILGVAQWFALMSRSFFSVFNEAYSFARLEPRSEQQHVPDGVAHEFLVFVLLAPLLVADLTRQFFPTLVACDAAPEFGFGVSACTITSREAEVLGTYAERRGDYIRFTRDGDDEEEDPKPCIGVPRRLRIHPSTFCLSRRVPSSIPG